MPILDKVALHNPFNRYKRRKYKDYYWLVVNSLQTESWQLFAVKPVVTNVNLSSLTIDQKKPKKRGFFGLVDLFNYISIKLLIFLAVVGPKNAIQARRPE